MNIFLFFISLALSTSSVNTHSYRLESLKTWKQNALELEDLKGTLYKLTSVNEFWREFLTAGRQRKYFLFSIWISICHNRTGKHFENRSKKLNFIAKMNFK